MNFSFIFGEGLGKLLDFGEAMLISWVVCVLMINVIIVCIIIVEIEVRKNLYSFCRWFFLVSELGV